MFSVLLLFTDIFITLCLFRIKSQNKHFHAKIMATRRHTIYKHTDALNMLTAKQK